MKDIEPLISSRTKSRIRVRSPEFVHSPEGEEAYKALKDIAGVKKAEYNPRTGSILLELDPEIFDEIEFKNTLLPFVPKKEEKAHHKAAHKAQTPVLLESGKAPRRTEGKKKSFMLSKKMRVVENKSMAAFGALSLGAVLLKKYGWHGYFGWAFTAAALLHTWRYRKHI